MPTYRIRRLHLPFRHSRATDSLRANGLIGGVVKATHLVRTPGAASCVCDAGLIRLTCRSRRTAPISAIAYASIVDANGTVVPTAVNPVTFTVSGPGRIISGDGNPTAAVAGIATVYVQTQYNTPGTIIVTGSASGPMLQQRHGEVCCGIKQYFHGNALRLPLLPREGLQGAAPGPARRRDLPFRFPPTMPARLRNRGSCFTICKEGWSAPGPLSPERKRCCLSKISPVECISEGWLRAVKNMACE